MKPLFIVNENAGKGKTKRSWSQIQLYLQQQGIEHEVHFTSRPREATEVAKQASSKFSHLIAVGGDGTVHEIINGMAGQQAVFGLIPTGTGNDFARMLNLPKDPVQAVQVLFQHGQKPVDLMTVNGTYIAGTVGIGIDGAVAEEINRASWKKRAGSFGYVLSMLQLLGKFPPFTLYLTIDDEPLIFQDCWLAAVGNSPFYGGGMKICPQAIADDGWLDICVAHGLSKLELLKLFPSVFSGKHIHHPNVSYLRGRTVVVQTDPTVPVHGDGEMLGGTPMDIRIQAQGLNVVG